jgi:predicted DCC family thiol-disulfide oxidoreductase YuxK
VGRWQTRAGGRFDVVPYQDAAARFPTLPVEFFRQAVRLIEPDGRVSSGAEAVFRGLALAPDGGRLLRAYERVPGFRPLADGLYNLVADHRPFFTWLTAPFDPEVAREAQVAPAAAARARRAWLGTAAAVTGVLGLLSLLGLRRRRR